ncbi:hypothetical protein KIF24_09535 [Micromonospora sp. Llam7]|uniref:hypothetical protein n=1 Tax=Micromonospora tarapacensis TaxID=2835305 RepID=UPI001C83F12C|nr:hypothetical protein [Micromonospora tarapacensis]MBX7266237.1 hypothetical protein [Micromonospora tarapacensis]
MAVVWGLIGSAVAESLNLYGMMRPTVETRGRWQWPWRDRRDRPIVLFAVALRMIVGTGLAAAAFSGGVATTAFSLFIFGVVGPLIIAKLFDQIRVLDSATPTPYEAAASARPGAAYGLTARLEPDERRVVEALSDGVSYDESQISSATLMPPSQVSAVLDRLVDRRLLRTEPAAPSVAEEPVNRRYRLELAHQPEEGQP